MVVRATTSGGLLYRPATETKVDDASLSSADRSELARLVAAAKLDAGDSKSPAARDARHYVLTVEGDGGKKSVEFDDLDPNLARHQLVAFVAAHAAPH